jgi:flagellar FliL protein
VRQKSAFIKEDEVAEENAAKEQAPAAPAPIQSKAPLLLIVLAVVNMLVVGGVGYMLYAGKKKEAAEPKLEHVIKGEADQQHEDASTEKAIMGTVVPLETFIVNLSGSKGRRIASVSMEIELNKSDVAKEIETRKAQVRDIIIILLSGKTYDEVATPDGKQKLRDEIKDTVNAFLTKGKITNVYFTEFIYN